MTNETRKELKTEVINAIIENLQNVPLKKLIEIHSEYIIPYETPKVLNHSSASTTKAYIS